MFRGRKIGAVRRFGKTGFIAACVFALVFVTRTGGTDAQSPAGSSSSAGAKKTVPADPSEMLPKGRRAYSMILDNSNAVLASASRGRRIDITAAFPAGPDGLPLATTVLKGVPVIGSKEASGGTALILSITPGEAERIAFAVANARIFVSLCPGGPDTAAPTQGVTFNDF